MTPAVRCFWEEFVRQVDDPAGAKARFYEAVGIGDTKASADEGAALVVAGRKTATSSLLWEYETTGKPPPEVGALSILIDGDEKPVCVFETTWLEVRAFSQVDAQFARDYGEWDGTLKTWRAQCWAYYADQCRALDRVPDREMPLLCERFRVVYPSTI